MITILDKGPVAPKAPDDKDDAVAVTAYRAAVKENEDWHKANPEPVKVTMDAIDARHAIAADPQRYSYVTQDRVLRKSGSIEERMDNAEEWLAELDAKVNPPKPAPAAAKAEPKKPAVETDEK